MKISIVATLYQSSPYIREFLRRASDAARSLVGDDYEIIFVNDGSPDNSLEVATEFVESDEHLIVVDLSRNFGHHKAMMTGLAHAQGDKIFLIDSDLEEEPEWLLPFAEHLDKAGCDVVYGVQTRRKGAWFERWSGHLYYTVLRALTGIRLPENVVTSRIMTKRFVTELLRHDEREMFLGGLFSLTGFTQLPMEVRKHSTSETTYTFRRKIILLVNTVTSFSNAPLKAIFYIGLLIFLFASCYVGYITIGWFFLSKPPSGWTSVIASIWLLGGMMISFLGIIGVYLSKVFVETKRRPYTVVRHIYGKRPK